MAGDEAQSQQWLDNRQIHGRRIRARLIPGALVSRWQTPEALFAELARKFETDERIMRVGSVALLKGSLTVHLTSTYY